MKNEYESNWPLDMHINVALYNSVFAEPEYCMMQKTTGEGLAFNSSVLSYGEFTTCQRTTSLFSRTPSQPAKLTSSFPAVTGQQLPIFPERIYYAS